MLPQAWCAKHFLVSFCTKGASIRLSRNSGSVWRCFYTSPPCFFAMRRGAKNIKLRSLFEKPKNEEGEKEDVLFVSGVNNVAERGKGRRKEEEEAACLSEGAEVIKFAKFA